jgi:hypothetical protein
MSSVTSQGTEKRAQMFDALNGYLEEIETEKQASAGINNPQTVEKSASPTPADPGGYQGPTTHPVKNVDNSVQESSEGARSAENTADVKDDQGEPAVDSGSDTGDGEQDKVQLNIGTNQSAVGEDPATEDDYKGDKDDPGTSHPMDAEDTGVKYSSASFSECLEKVAALSNDICADLATHPLKLTKEGMGGGDREVTAGGSKMPSVGEGNPAPGEKKSKDDKDPSGSTPSTNDMASSKGTGENKEAAQKAAAAGYDLAAMMGLEKMSSAELVETTTQQTIRDADLNAELVGSYLHSYAQAKHAAAKAAMEGGMEGEEEGENHEEESEEGGEGGGVPEGAPGDAGMGGEMPMGGEEMGGAGGADPEAMLAALAGGGGMPGEEGGMPPGGMPGEEGGMPGAPPMGPEGMGGMEGGDDQMALNQLFAALQELGITPPEMMGAPGMEGPEAPPKVAAAKLYNLGKAVSDFQKSGKARLQECKTAEERKVRDYMKNHVIELFRRKG